MLKSVPKSPLDQAALTPPSARQELATPPKTTLDQAYHFGMYMMKAVLDGRATQLIDFEKVNLSRRES
jgi:hypothetical protein